MVFKYCTKCQVLNRLHSVSVVLKKKNTTNYIPNIHIKKKQCLVHVSFLVLSFTNFMVSYISLSLQFFVSSPVEGVPWKTDRRGYPYTSADSCYKEQGEALFTRSPIWADLTCNFTVLFWIRGCIEQLHNIPDNQTTINFKRVFRSHLFVVDRSESATARLSIGG